MGKNKFSAAKGALLLHGRGEGRTQTYRFLHKLRGRCERAK